jgi:DNA-binding FadR family transcriptional regulator
MMVSRPEPEAVADGVSRALALHDVSLRDVWEGLMVLEPPIAAAAATRRESADLAAIEAVIARDPAASTDVAARQAADFFREVGMAAHNRVLGLAHEPLLQLLAPSLRRMIDQVAAARGRIATAQRRILAAIRAGEVDAARTWTEKHIRDYRRGFELAGIDLADRVD